VARNPAAATIGGASNQSTAAMRITEISPAAGITGDSIVVRGTGFAQDAVVAIDGIPANTIVILSTELRMTAPSHPLGSVDLTVTNGDGRTATALGGFKYEAITVMTSSSVAAPGEQLVAVWSTPVSRVVQNDYVILAKTTPPYTGLPFDWEPFQYARSTTGTMTATAPLPGTYEFRYMLGGGKNELAARSGPIAVR
jgi:hypothetical protein